MSSGPAHPGVLVGVDGSPSSRVAVRWAAHEATVRNIPLTPVHVVSTPAVSSSALSWPAVPIPAELRQWQEDEAAKVMADAIKLVEDSATEGARPEIKSELFFSAPVPTLVDVSKETQMVGCRGCGALRRGLPRFGQHRVDPPRPRPRRGDSRQSSVVDATGVGWD